MTALAHGSQRPKLSSNEIYHFGPQKAATTVYQGSLVMTDTSARIMPAAANVSGATYCVGVARPRDGVLDRYDNSAGADGALSVEYEEGAFGFDNDTGNPILSTTEPGTPVYAVDDHTVSLAATGTRPFAGRLLRLDTSITGSPVVVQVSPTLGASLAAIAAAT